MSGFLWSILSTFGLTSYSCSFAITQIVLKAFPNSAGQVRERKGTLRKFPGGNQFSVGMETLQLLARHLAVALIRKPILCGLEVLNTMVCSSATRPCSLFPPRWIWLMSPMGKSWRQQGKSQSHPLYLGDVGWDLLVRLRLLVMASVDLHLLLSLRRRFCMPSSTHGEIQMTYCSHT